MQLVPILRQHVSELVQDQLRTLLLRLPGREIRVSRVDSQSYTAPIFAACRAGIEQERVGWRILTSAAQCPQVNSTASPDSLGCYGRPSASIQMPETTLSAGSPTRLAPAAA